MNWSRGMVPLAYSAVEQAKELGLVPLNMGSREFEVVNYFSSFALYSGTIHKSFDISISSKAEELQYLSAVLEEIDIGSRITQKNVLYTTKNSRVLGRLLYALGLPWKGYKSTQYLVLPNNIDDLMIEHNINDDSEIEIKLIQDYVAGMFKSRLQKTKASYELILNSNRNEEKSKDFLYQHECLLKLIFPDITMLPNIYKRSIVKMDDSSHELYIPIITFPVFEKEVLDEFISRKKRPLDD